MLARALLLLAIFCGVTPAEASQSPRRASDSTKSVSSVSEALQGSKQWALGFSDTSTFAGGQSVSALFSSGRDWIQAFLTVPSTRGGFQFGAGGAYKFTIAGNQRAGFHVGPALVLGTVSVLGQSKFAFSLGGAVGAHYTLVERLILSVDGGPMISVVDGDVNFRLSPFGEFLGLSLHYLF